MFRERATFRKTSESSSLVVNYHTLKLYYCTAYYVVHGGVHISHPEIFWKKLATYSHTPCSTDQVYCTMVVPFSVVLLLLLWVYYTIAHSNNQPGYPIIQTKPNIYKCESLGPRNKLYEQLYGLQTPVQKRWQGWGPKPESASTR